MLQSRHLFILDVSKLCHAVAFSFFFVELHNICNKRRPVYITQSSHHHPTPFPTLRPPNPHHTRNTTSSKMANSCRMLIYMRWNSLERNGNIWKRKKGSRLQRPRHAALSSSKTLILSFFGKMRNFYPKKKKNFVSFTSGVVLISCELIRAGWRRQSEWVVANFDLSV